MLTRQMLNEIDLFPREIAQLFRSLQPVAEAFSSEPVPKFKLREKETAYQLTAALPGIDVEKLEIDVLGRRLNISGATINSEIPEGAIWHRRERRRGSFSQSFVLPEQVDSEQVSAEYKNGILHIELPKVPAVLPKKIAVKAG